MVDENRRRQVEDAIEIVDLHVGIDQQRVGQAVIAGVGGDGRG